MLIFNGSLPGSLDLSSLGVFFNRQYSKEPLRCYRSQQFGHHKARCNWLEFCSIYTSQVLLAELHTRRDRCHPSAQTKEGNTTRGTAATLLESPSC